MSQQPKCILVLGPESSGTRLLTRLLIQAGCAGSGEHAQPFDQKLPKAEDVPVVWRRSFPHDGQWPDIGALAKSARAGKYDPAALVILRDWQATAASQVAAPHVATAEQAEANIAEAYERIFSGLAAAKLPWRVVTYEGLILHPYGTMSWVAAWAGLPPLFGEVLTSGNAKYLEPEPGETWR